ncbi:probable tubulin polyglutamylase TTLL9 isoform X2 [Pomacea canaliculata]|uniref:probable tubulin polyglutamylase TTLL9 isoform X2 n=1 Tax=Pomacea canaliculata TaxID=400727 RepID=UPI000D73F96F|nr:probable tubulin polyglutamylase TTLL9 isoform X2 [Pomacea canaliculata]
MSRTPIARNSKGTGNQVIRFKCTLQNTILDVLKARPGWKEASGDLDWDFYWFEVSYWKELFDHTYLEEHVRVNHFRNHCELTRKNLMARNLKRLRRSIAQKYGKTEAQKCNFFPSTYELPSEYHIFVETYKKCNPGFWIMKPVAKSQGKGIFLFKRLKDITVWRKGTDSQRLSDQTKETPETYVVQRYIENPYLIGGRKFDLRIYVLVTSYIPLKAWLYRSGFARFSNTRFSMKSIHDSYVHLTNVAIQRTAPDYDPEKGCKWSLQQLRKYLTAKHGIEAVEELFRQINDIFTYSLQSCQNIIIHDKRCFALYGYDILIDANFKPWLIEINLSPSLKATNYADYKLKFGLLDDVLNIVDMENRLTGKEKHVGLFDLFWDDGPVYLEDSDTSDCINGPTLNTFLGCVGDRMTPVQGS